MPTKIKKLLTLATSDKALHCLYSFALTMLFVALLGWIGLVVPCLIGVAKEIYDKYFGNGWGWWDIVADAVGIVCAIIILLIL